MIHRISVGPETVVADLKKLVRKKLMTGGAVVRLDDAAKPEELRQILEIFTPGAEPHGIQAEVLAEIARHPACTPELEQSLRGLGLPGVDRMLQLVSAGRAAAPEERKDQENVR